MFPHPLLDMAGVKGNHQLVRAVPKCVAGFVYTERGKSTINSFCLDLDYNSSLKNGTFQMTRLRKPVVIVIDEFSMLDFYLLRTIEGLCRKFAKHGSSRHP